MTMLKELAAKLTAMSAGKAQAGGSRVVAAAGTVAQFYQS